jgi:hypothetical protein
MMSAIKQKTEPAPDVIVMNSCLWDITRYVIGVKWLHISFRVLIQETFYVVYAKHIIQQRLLGPDIVTRHAIQRRHNHP